MEPNSNIVILTGAGISAESGLQTFRAADGLWEGHRVEDVATPEAFMRNAALVHNFYNERRAQLLLADVQPNAAHIALAALQEQWPQVNGGQVTIITQNIDNLHERGGAKDVIHMHGELLKMFCVLCASSHNHEVIEKQDITSDLGEASVCGLCGQAGGLRPDIVWFGEMPYAMDDIAARIAACTLFISIGTSGNVYPAAGFVREAYYAGADTMEVNLEPSINAEQFDEGFYGLASEQVPALVRRLIQQD